MDHSKLTNSSQWAVNPAVDLFNQTLYGMCAKAPFHKDPKDISAKMTLIGRAYSASPSRGAGEATSKKDANFFEFLGRAIGSNFPEFDDQLSDVRKRGRISKDTIQDAAALHGKLNQIIVNCAQARRVKLSKQRQIHGRVSFVSKYLHFHAPIAFFIYDSVIVNRLRCRESGLRGYRSKGQYPTFGKDYGRLCEMLLLYAKDLHDPSWTPRSIDARLYPYSFGS